MVPVLLIHICHPGADAADPDPDDPDQYDEAVECEESEAASDDEIVDPNEDE